MAPIMHPIVNSSIYVTACSSHLGKLLLSVESSLSPLNQVRDIVQTTTISSEQTVQNYSANKTIIICQGRLASNLDLFITSILFKLPIITINY